MVVAAACCATVVAAETEASIPPAALAQLASDRFREREAAQRTLLHWGRSRGDEGSEIFYALSTSAGDPEVRERCMEILRELVNGEYAKTFEGFLGINLREMAVQVPGEKFGRSGIAVVAVYHDTPAERGGILPGDIVVAVDGKSWERNQQILPLFQAKIRSFAPGTEVSLRVIRAGKVVEVAVTLGGMVPHDDLDRFAGPWLDLEGVERAAKEAYLRKWLSARKLRK